MCVPANGLNYFCRCKRHLVGLIVFAFYNAAAKDSIGKDAGSSDLQPSMCRIHEQLGTITSNTSIPQSRCQVFDVGFLIAQLVPVSDSFKVRNYHRSVLVTIQKTLEAFLSRSLGYYVIHSEILHFTENRKPTIPQSTEIQPQSIM